MKKIMFVLVALILLFSCSALADTLTLTSGTFGLSHDSFSHSLGFTVYTDRGFIWGSMTDDTSGGSLACNFSGVGSTSCSGWAGLTLDGISYPYASVSASPFISDAFVLNTPGLGEFSASFDDTFSVSMFACLSPLQNCVSVFASGPAITTIHYVEVNPSFMPGVYKETSISGVIVPEPSTLALLGSGALGLLGAVRRRLLS